FVELLKRKKIINQEGGQESIDDYNVLAEADTPVYIVKQPESSIQIYPKDFNTSDPRPRSNLRNLAETPVASEFNYFEQSVLPPRPGQFIKNEAPETGVVNFPPDEKKWLNVMPSGKEINYPEFVLKNTRELCYNNINKD